MSVRLLNDHHFECLTLKGGCIGWSEYILVKMPHCWKLHVVANLPLQSGLNAFCGCIPDIVVVVVVVLQFNTIEQNPTFNAGEPLHQDQ